MTIDPTWLPYIAGISVALAAGPLGCLVLWQRLAPIGDSLGHTALVGAALAISLSLPPVLGITITAAAMGLGLQWGLRRAHERHTIPPEALLAVCSSVSLAVGMLIMHESGIDHHALESLLFGEITHVSQTEALTAAAVALTVLTASTRYWKRWVRIAIQPQLAAAEGLPLQRLQLIQMLLLSGTLAIAMQLGGLLLATALLLLPAVAARPLARTPAGMAITATLLGTLTSVAGITSSDEHLSAGPIIIIGLLASWAITSLIKKSA